MGHRFADLLFSEPVKQVQQEQDSSDKFLKWETKADFNDRLTLKETSFLSQRDSFYLATVSPDGWPYIQHRGGRKGFIKVLDDKHIGFADFRGNRQYITTGNVRGNNRVACFFMDYQERRRLKMLGYAKEVRTGTSEALGLFTDSEHSNTIERGFIIQVEAFDWNCSAHITRRIEQPLLL